MHGQLDVSLSSALKVFPFRTQFESDTWITLPAPLAWTTLSGILSWPKCAISSKNVKSWMSMGPLSPTVKTAFLSSIGHPEEVVNLDSTCQKKRKALENRD